MVDDRTDHKWECNRRCFNTLDDPHADEADELNDSEKVDTVRLYVTQEYIVRLMFDGH